MEEPWLIVSILFLFGLLFGSFAGASVWRLRARQLTDDVAEGEPVDPKEFERLSTLTGTSVSSDRSRCLGCGHLLAWYDLLPLVSWASLQGRCRYCKVRIGHFEPLMELGVASMFAVSFYLWPAPLDTTFAVVQFGLWLAAVVLLAILFAYDLKWFLLPDRIVFPLMGVGVFMSIVRFVETPEATDALISTGGAVLVLSGLYYVLWLVSHGRWIGFGDVKLGLALAVLLGDWRLALIALFAANLIGSALVIPGMLTGRIDRKSHVPFGPLLIAGAVLAMLVGQQVVSWYQAVVF